MFSDGDWRMMCGHEKGGLSWLFGERRINFGHGYLKNRGGGSKVYFFGRGRKVAWIHE